MNKKSCLLLSLAFISSCGSADYISNYKKSLGCPDAVSVYVENEKTKVFFSDHGFFLNRNSAQEIKYYVISFSNDAVFKRLDGRRLEVDGSYEAHLSGYYLDRDQCPALIKNTFIVVSVGDEK